MAYSKPATSCVAYGSNGFVFQTDTSMGALAHGSQGEELRQDGATLADEGVIIWEHSAGFQTQEIYDAPEHLHAIELAQLSDLNRVLECKPQDILSALAHFFAAGGLLSDLMEALDCIGTPYAYGTATSTGEVAFRSVNPTRCGCPATETQM